MDHGVVQRWLRQVLSPYGDPDRVYADVDRTLISISSLSPKTEVYTYDDGRTQLLLVLTGTIPITFRTSTYNIPMALWLPRGYPREAPMAYVTPTNDMLVRKGKSVELDGRVTGEYMAQWQRKWEACNLLDLIRDCQANFGQMPPVYAKPKVAPQIHSQNYSATPAPQVPSTSSSSQAYAPASPSASSVSIDRRDRGPPAAPFTRSPAPEPMRQPSIPPKPGNSVALDHFRRSSNGSMYAASPVSPHSQRPISMYDGPPIPRTDTGSSHLGGQEGAISYNGMRSRTLPPEQDAMSVARNNSRHASWNGGLSQADQQQAAYIRSGHMTPSQQAPALPAGHPHRAASGPPLPPHASTDAPPENTRSPPLPPPLPGTARGMGPPRPEFVDGFPGNYMAHPPTGSIPGPSDMNSASIPAPPRPPNPELLQMHAQLHSKIEARLHHLRSTTEASNGQLRLLTEDLDRGDLAIKDEMARLEAVRDVCRATGDQLQGAVQAASDRAAELGTKEEPDVDGLLSATSLVGNQLIDLVAEDNAIEDTLYHLGRALSSEVIDLDRFLKQTRFLAREQFMRRALAQKICQGMGWEAL